MRMINGLEKMAFNDGLQELSVFSLTKRKDDLIMVCKHLPGNENFVVKGFSIGLTKVEEDPVAGR